MRGLAALMVAVGHTTTIIEKLQVYDWSTLNRGNAFAFLVLSRPTPRSRSSSFSEDSCSASRCSAWRATTRSANSKPSPASVADVCCRCTGVAIVYLYLLLDLRQNHGFASGWFNQLLPASPSQGLFVQNLLVCDTHQPDPVVDPGRDRDDRGDPAARLAGRPALAHRDSGRGGADLRRDVSRLLPRCLSYIFGFHAGLLLPVIGRHDVCGRIMRRWWAAPAALAGLFVMEAWFRLGFLPFASPVNHQIKYLVDSALCVLLIGNILLRQDLPAMRFLDAAPLERLGTLSYGLYVYQLLFMDIVAQLVLRAGPGSARSPG
jgi:hypothetical protein